MVDPIADMLTRIRNAQAVNHRTVDVPFSKIKMDLAELLSRKGWLGEVAAKGKKVGRIIEIGLKYEDKKPIINNLKRISKCGCRLYIKKKEIKPIRQGYGISVISTSQGLMTGEEARKKGLGGEIICEIY